MKKASFIKVFITFFICFSPSWSFSTMEKEYERFLIKMLTSPQLYLENPEHHETIVSLKQRGYTMDALEKYATKNQENVLSIADWCVNDECWRILLQSAFPKSTDLSKYFLTQGITAKQTARGYFSLGFLYDKSGKIPQAIECYKRSGDMGLHGSYLFAARALGNDPTLLEAKRFLELASQSGWILADLYLAEQGKDEETKLQALKKTIERGYVPSFLELAKRFSEKGNHKKSIKLLFKALDHGYDDAVDPLMLHASKRHDKDKEDIAFSVNFCIPNKLKNFYFGRAVEGLYTDYLNLFDKVYGDPLLPFNSYTRSESSLDGYYCGAGCPKDDPHYFYRMGLFHYRRYFSFGPSYKDAYKFFRKAIDCSTFGDLPKDFQRDTHEHLVRIQQENYEYYTAWKASAEAAVSLGTPPIKLFRVGYLYHFEQKFQIELCKFYLESLPYISQAMLDWDAINLALQNLQLLTFPRVYGLAYFLQKVLVREVHLFKDWPRIHDFIRNQETYVPNRSDYDQIANYRKNTHSCLSLLMEASGKIRLAGKMKDLPKLAQDHVSALPRIETFISYLLKVLEVMDLFEALLTKGKVVNIQLNPDLLLPYDDDPIKHPLYQVGGQCNYHFLFGSKARTMAKIMKEANGMEEEILQSLDVLQASGLFKNNAMNVEPKELFEMFRDHIMQFHDRDFSPRS